MPEYQLETFLASLRMAETGSYSGAYNARHRESGAIGAYQILPGNWVAWSSQVGLPGADWRDPRAQDYVARRKASEYYRRFGSWELVALAWFAGERAAETVMAVGMESAAGIRDAYGVGAADYATAVSRGMGSAPEQYKAAERRWSMFSPDDQAQYDPAQLSPPRNVAEVPRGTSAPGADLEEQLRQYVAAIEAANPDAPPNPLRPKLVRELSMIADAVAGGQRSALPDPVQEVEVPLAGPVVAPAADLGPQPAREPATQGDNVAAGSGEGGY